MTAEAAIQNFEPVEFAAGDTLLFQRFYEKYQPGAGWALNYVLTNTKGIQVAQIAAQAATAQFPNGFLVDVDDFAAALPAGFYILEGHVSNGAERHRVYLGGFQLKADLADGTAKGPLLTEAQQMMETLTCTLKTLYARLQTETQVERTRFVLQDIKKTREELAYWTERRVQEVERERARNGRPPGNVIRAFFGIGA